MKQSMGQETGDTASPKSPKAFSPRRRAKVADEAALAEKQQRIMEADLERVDGQKRAMEAVDQLNTIVELKDKLKEAIISKEEAKMLAVSLEGQLEDIFEENEEEMDALEGELEDALKKAAQAEMDAQDAKRRGKKDLKKQASTLKELQRALAKEKQAREGLDKALEALLSGGLSAPGAEKATANAREIRTEAAKLLSASDENGLREVLTERAELQAQARELRASLIKANQKVQFLEENGQLIAGDLAHLKDVTDQNRDLKSKNEELTDQISDLEQEILILSEDQKEKTKMLTDYIQAPADGPRRERRRRGSNDSTSSIQSREDVQSTFDRIREA